MIRPLLIALVAATSVATAGTSKQANSSFMTASEERHDGSRLGLQTRTMMNERAEWLHAMRQSILYVDQEYLVAYFEALGPEPPNALLIEAMAWQWLGQHVQRFGDESVDLSPEEFTKQILDLTAAMSETLYNLLARGGSLNLLDQFDLHAEQARERDAIGSQCYELMIDLLNYKNMTGEDFHDKIIKRHQQTKLDLAEEQAKSADLEAALKHSTTIIEDMKVDHQAEVDLVLRERATHFKHAAEARVAGQTLLPVLAFSLALLFGSWSVWLFFG